jgi:hypothetical protein
LFGGNLFTSGQVDPKIYKDFTIKNIILKGGMCNYCQALRKRRAFLMPKNKRKGKIYMAEKNENEVFSGENKTPDENLASPAEQPGQEQSDNTPPLDNPAPEVIDTLPAPEADKQAASKEAEKAAEQVKEENAPKRRGRQPQTFNH